jgi:hypothetical protein
MAGLFSPFYTSFGWSFGPNPTFSFIQEAQEEGNHYQLLFGE